MKLHQEQIRVLKDKLKTISSTTQLYLFGSRVDDEKKGVDIDTILDDEEFKNLFTKHSIKKAILL